MNEDWIWKLRKKEDYFKTRKPYNNRNKMKRRKKRIVYKLILIKMIQIIHNKPMNKFKEKETKLRKKKKMHHVWREVN